MMSKKNIQSKVLMLNAILMSSLNHGWTSKLWKKLKSSTDLQNWSWTNRPNKDMISLTAVIQTQQTVLAAVGEDAEFSCQLLQTKDVLQVTWQKISHDVETNVAMYNKQFGQRMNDGFTDKFKFKYHGLQNCSIVIRNVTEQDEGCYHCLFNTYPEGSFTGKTCLQVYELHEPVVDVRESNSTEEWVVSCSATGRPAPTVTLSVSQQDLNFSQYNTVSVSNTNATFTVTTTAVLSGSRKHSTQVGCAARVLSAPHREVMVTIPEVQKTSVGGFSSITVIAVVVLVLGFVFFSCSTLLLEEKLPFHFLLNGTQ
ncbi:OX-2 membrane glycoprotein-like isoform X1 [Oreochromis aureus]|uniref:Ig-like domain-containing protein n=1 Tax=Oreochromis aureus TaxID=47969 RepID=A0AAZ1XQB2_OREAU|nr:OX-2 membrane glycoprotein-like isoform X1 [Oreochromis aureus]